MGNELARLQHFMIAQLRRRQALTKDAELARAAAEHFTGNERVPPIEQLDIYREQFWLRHTSSLVEDFPGLGGILGQHDWERLAEEYLESVAPTDWSLRSLGDRLPEFVASRQWLPHGELCTDMARLEWAYIEVFDAPDVPPLDAARLAALDERAWQSARIVLNPALRLLSVEYPVADLRRELRSGAAEVPIPERAPQHLAVFRVERELYDQPIDGVPFSLLKELEAGTSLIDAATRIVQRFPEHAGEIKAEVGSWFQAWAERSVIVGVERRDTP
jgi:hypothetical protein